MTKCFVDNCKMSGNHTIKEDGPGVEPLFIKLCDKHKDLYFEGSISRDRIIFRPGVFKDVRA